MVEKHFSRGPCWVAFSSQHEPIKTADGSHMKLKPYICPHAWECVNRFSNTLFLEETTRMTELGLVTDPNPLGINLMLEWLGKRCIHPEKRKILAHIASLDPLGVVIPRGVLRSIEKHAGGESAMYVAKHEPAKLVFGYKPYIKKHNFPKVRCSFWLLAWANGCHYNCEYCWLKSYHPWSWTEIHVAEKTSLARVLRRFSSKVGGGQLLNAGELCDSFVSPEYIPFMASVFRKANEVYGRGHRLLLLTKSADPSVLLQGAYQDMVVYSVSVNTETVAKQLELGAPSPNKRVHAAMRVKEADYEVRVRVDPIIAGSNPAYVGLMERVCCHVEPDLITLGYLRATPRTYRSLPDPVKAQLTERTPWGRGYPLTTRLSLYNELIDVALRYGVPVALCKEPPEVWRSLKLQSKCNCMP